VRAATSTVGRLRSHDVASTVSSVLRTASGRRCGSKGP